MEPAGIVQAIEAHHWDIEEGYRPRGLHEDSQPGLYMRKFDGSNSIHGNKVAKSVWLDAQLDERLEYCFSFFGDKCFSWWIGPHSRPDRLMDALVERGLHVEDRYVGLASPLADVQIEVDSSVQVGDVRTEAELLEHHRVSVAVWGGDRSPDSAGFEERTGYLKFPNRRGGYVVAMDCGTGIGNAAYRVSRDGRVLYLTGAAVLPAYRRRGIYHELLSYRVNLARDLGCQMVTTQARVGTSAPILKKLGFREFSRYVLLART